jgi:hypothetical protein
MHVKKVLDERYSDVMQLSSNTAWNALVKIKAAFQWHSRKIDFGSLAVLLSLTDN